MALATIMSQMKTVIKMVKTQKNDVERLKTATKSESVPSRPTSGFVKSHKQRGKQRGEKV